MKRIILFITILVITLVSQNVYAANYNIKELIPVNKHTTIGTNNFRYIDFYYNDNEMEADGLKNNFIIFSKIKNVSDEKKAVTVSIGLFDKDKKNIGTINYCSTKDKTSVVAGTELNPDEEKSYVIEVNKKYLADKKTVKDIEYISILSDNPNCTTGSSLDFVGQTVDEIGQIKNTGLSDDAELLIKILTGIGIVAIIIFVYNFMFSTRYKNFNGEDVRQEYSYINKELEAKRKYDAIHNPTPPKKVKEVKTQGVKAQEERENSNANKESSDLHNFYK